MRAGKSGERRSIRKDGLTDGGKLRHVRDKGFFGNIPLDSQHRSILTTVMSLGPKRERNKVRVSGPGKAVRNSS